MNTAEWLSMKTRAHGRLEDDQLCLYWTIQQVQSARDAAELLPTATCLQLARTALQRQPEHSARACSQLLARLLVEAVHQRRPDPVPPSRCAGLTAADRITSRGQAIIGEAADAANGTTAQLSLLDQPET
jgi:hypothetical protein